MKSNRPTGLYIGSCASCGKLMFESKRDAKVAARRAHPAEVLAFYRCGSFWHYGHLPPKVKQGVYGRTTRS